MSAVDFIFLGFVIAAFLGYGFLLFGTWLVVEVFGKKKTHALVAAPEIAAAARARTLA